MWIDPGTIAVGVAWDRRRDINKAIRKVVRWVMNGTLRVVVFGAGGTGKTTLGIILSSGRKSSYDLTAYEESSRIKKFELQGDVIGSLIVPPGQKRRRDTWDHLFQSLSAGKSTGVINLVSWGHHSLGEISFKEHKLYKKGMGEKDF